MTAAAFYSVILITEPPGLFNEAWEHSHYAEKSCKTSSRLDMSLSPFFTQLQAKAC